MIQNDKSSEEIKKTIFSYIGCIADERDIDRLIHLMSEMGRELLDAEKCIMWILDRQNSELWTRGFGESHRTNMGFSNGVVGNVVSSRKPLVINEVCREDRYVSYIEHLVKCDVRNIVVVPILDRED